MVSRESRSSVSPLPRTTCSETRARPELVEASKLFAEADARRVNPLASRTMKPAGGFTLRNRCTSGISYSSLNFLRVIDRSIAASTTPLCANSMILDATNRMARSSLSRRPNSAQTVSNTTEMLRIASGAKADPSRNGPIGIGPFPSGVTLVRVPNVTAVRSSGLLLKCHVRRLSSGHNHFPPRFPLRCVYEAAQRGSRLLPHTRPDLPFVFGQDDRALMPI